MKKLTIIKIGSCIAHLILGVALSTGSVSASAHGNASILDFLPGIIGATQTSRPEPPQPGFVVRLPTAFTGPEYLIDPAQWNINTNKTNPIQTTNRIQAAIDEAVNQGFGRIRLPAGDYLIGKPLESGAVDIYLAGIELPGNVHFAMDQGARLFMTPNDKWNYCVIRISKTENVVVSGGTIIGDRYEHTYTPDSSGRTNHDEGHGICLEGSNRVLIENMLLKELTGDGVLAIGRSHDVTIRDNEMSTNRRQGVSTVGSYRINIQGNYIHDTRGTNPEFGVDVEGTSQFAGFDRDIIIQNNTFFGNRGGAVLNASGRNVHILNNMMTEKAGTAYRYTTAPITLWQKADAVISGNRMSKASGSSGDGIIEYAGGVAGNDDGTRKLVIYNNSCQGCGLILRPSFSGVDIRNNRFGGHIFWLIDVKNATIIDNNHQGNRPTDCFSFRFQNVTGYAAGNTFNNAPYNLPLKQTVPYSNGCPQTDV